MLIRLCLVLSTFALGCVDDATASDTQASSGQSQQPRRPPPKEAFDACAGSSDSAVCAFDIDGHHITGACHHGPDGQGPLACVPDHPPPPPEALAACDSSTAGATCAFDIDGHHVDGTCRTGPDAGSPLACAPSQPPPPH
jgi:hypothetical protein